MFNLVYRDGAPENTGHYEVFEKDTGSGKALPVGTLVSVTNGKAIKYASGKPYGVVAINAADGEDEVAVLRITDDMIFRVAGDSDPVCNMHLKKQGDIVKIGAMNVGDNMDGSQCFEISTVVNKGIEEKGILVNNVVEGRFIEVSA